MTVRPRGPATKFAAGSNGRGFVRPLARLLRRRRRWVAAGLAGLAVTAALGALAPPPTPTSAVVVAAHDLALGQPLSAADLAVRRLPTDLVPGGTQSSTGPLLNRSVSGAVRAGEPITDARLIGPSMLLGLPGLVAVAVRLSDDAATASLVRPGDRIDLVARPVDPVGTAPPDAASGSPALVPAPGDDQGVLARAAIVLAVPAPAAADSLTGGAGGALDGSVSVIVAVSPAIGARLARLSTSVGALLRVTS